MIVERDYRHYHGPWKKIPRQIERELNISDILLRRYLVFLLYWQLMVQVKGKQESSSSSWSSASASATEPRRNHGLVRYRYPRLSPASFGRSVLPLPVAGTLAPGVRGRYWSIHGIDSFYSVRGGVRVGESGSFRSGSGAVARQQIVIIQPLRRTQTDQMVLTYIVYVQ